MKRILSLLVSIVFLLNTTLANTVTVLTNGTGFSVTFDSDQEVEVIPENPKINGWEVKSGDITLTDNKFTMPENNVDIEGVMNTYTIKYNANGGINTPAETIKSYGLDATITISSPQNDGYVFKGWSRNPNATEVEYVSGETYSENKSTILYAVWETIKVYTINYDANAEDDEVTNMPGNDTKTHGVGFIISSNIPIRSGYTFVGWNTESNSNGTNYNAGETYNIDENVTLYAKWTENDVSTYTVSYNKNTEDEVTNMPENDTKTHGADLTISDIIPTRSGYVFVGWNTENDGSGTIYNVSASYTVDSDVTLHAMWRDDSEWNDPILGYGMTPVNWDATNEAWIDANILSWEYDYNSVAETTSNGTIEGNGSGKWANARTEDGSMWVWIPRYTYKIVSGKEASNVISWNSDLYDPDDADYTAGKIQIKFSDETEDDTSGSYIVHPGFNLGTEKLTGIWVAKYEMSMETNTNTNTAAKGNVLISDTVKMVSKPGNYSWRYITASNAFTNSYNYNRVLDSHLMRNKEWGAVAYLTNAIGRTPYINTNGSYKTGYAAATEDSNATTSYAWNTEKGVKASTTHNVYGIYDMSGGAYDVVAAYYDGGDSEYLEDDVGVNEYFGALYEAANTTELSKYVDVYTNAYSSANKGDAMYETSSSGDNGDTGWDGDCSWASNVTYPGIDRGGRNTDNIYSGIYYFTELNNYDYGTARVYGGFRTTLTPRTSNIYTISYNANGGVGAPESQLKTLNAVINLSDAQPAKIGCRFLGWSTDSTATNPTYLKGGLFELNQDTTLYAVYEKANEPILGTGMTPVNWDVTTTTWVDVDTTVSDWEYDYNSVAETTSNGTIAGNGSGKWANARTEDGSMWVWIPRYTYKIVSGKEASNVISWNSDLYDPADTDYVAGKILVKFSDGTEDDTNDNYIVHPGFNLGTEKLTGIWVAKYEMSKEVNGENKNTSTVASGNVLISDTVKMVSKPGVYGWRNITVSNAFTNSYNYNRVLDSHLMRNKEWGAVAYLTNAIGRTPYINNNSSYRTGYSAITQDATEATTKLWNTTQGVKASTTHNVYGIYDMSGGSYDVVAAYYVDGDDEYLVDDVGVNEYFGALYEAANTTELSKYVDTYTNAFASTSLGDATYEVCEDGESTGWDGDASDSPDSTYPGMERGGVMGEPDSTATGIYHITEISGYDTCGTAREFRGFRVTLAVRQP